MVEPQIVVLVVAGSSPVLYPIFSSKPFPSERMALIFYKSPIPVAGMSCIHIKAALQLREKLQRHITCN